MTLYDHEIDLQSLPFDLRDCRAELGLIKSAVFKCPGIYLLHMFNAEGRYAGLDVYVVMDSASIPAEARDYGQTVPSHPELLFYPDEGEDFAYKIIEYEIIKFYIKYGIPVKESEDLHTRSLFGMEVCPDYFGALPAPSVTPWGYTTRYKTLIPGAFWVETDQCKSALAMSQVMRDDISEEILSLAVLTPFDQEHGIDETMGYYFFREKDMCLAIFELMLFNCNCKWDLINKAALMNAIWADFPKYAIAYNRREQEGLNDGFGMAMQMIDPDYELQGDIKNMITITPGAGIDFLHFRRFSKQPR